MPGGCSVRSYAYSIDRGDIVEYNLLQIVCSGKFKNLLNTLILIFYQNYD
jgi:hypothetical protein